jgi:hypothetical protein
MQRENQTKCSLVQNCQLELHQILTQIAIRTSQVLLGIMDIHATLHITGYITLQSILVVLCQYLGTKFTANLHKILPMIQNKNCAIGQKIPERKLHWKIKFVTKPVLHVTKDMINVWCCICRGLRSCKYNRAVTGGWPEVHRRYSSQKVVGWSNQGEPSMQVITLPTEARSHDMHTKHYTNTNAATLMDMRGFR